MKLAIGYSTKDQVENTEQTFARISEDMRFDVYWGDGSTDKEARDFFAYHKNCVYQAFPDIRGGADAAIAWKLSEMLKHPYTHIGLLENDVLLDEDWFEPTMALFEKGERDGLSVGAVSPRSYVDRVLVQRDGYAVMHNIGAGAIVFTREAAEIVLRTFRTHWWPDNVRTFATLAGIDLRTYAAFRGLEQFVTTDWGFEAQLARHGLASLALTPARCQMVGQNPPLAQQGLELTTSLHAMEMWNRSGEGHSEAFKKFAATTLLLRGKTLYHDRLMSYELPGLLHREGASMLFFPHQLGAINAQWSGTKYLKWNQGFGPFAYVAGPGGASLSLHISGSCSFLCSGGTAGASIKIQDTRSGFNFAPNLPPDTGQPLSIAVPGTPVPRTITVDFSEGAVFYGLQCAEPQMIDTTFRFDHSQLPEPLL